MIGTEYIYEAAKPSSIKRVDRGVQKAIRHNYNTVFSRFDNFFKVEGPRSSSKYNELWRGTIKNKSGEEFDIVVRNNGIETENNYGRSATDYYVKITIYDVLDGEDAQFEATYKYNDPDNKYGTEGLVDDLKKGTYLEDYFAKHMDSLAEECAGKFDSIIKTGNAAADSYYSKARAREARARDNFWDGKIKIHNTFGWEVREGKVSVTLQSTSTSDEDVRHKAEAIVATETATAISNAFPGVSVSNLSGIVGTGEIIGLNGGALYADIKKNELVSVNQDKSAKVAGANISIQLGKEVTADPAVASPFVASLFAATSAAVVKSMKKTEYVEQHYREFQQKLREQWFGRYHWRRGMSGSPTVQDGKQAAREEFERLKIAATWDGKAVLKFSLSELKNHIADALELNARDNTNTAPEPVVEPAVNPQEPTQSAPKPAKPAKPVKAGSKAERDAIEKMTAWHNGTRGFNAKSASEAKLKLNYKVCKELGFDQEASLIKAEADSRGIVLECDFIEWIQVIMECNNEYDNID